MGLLDLNGEDVQENLAKQLQDVIFRNLVTIAYRPELDPPAYQITAMFGFGFGGDPYAYHAFVDKLDNDTLNEFCNNAILSFERLITISNPEGEA